MYWAEILMSTRLCEPKYFNFMLFNSLNYEYKYGLSEITITGFLSIRSINFSISSNWASIFSRRSFLGNVSVSSDSPWYKWCNSDQLALSPYGWKLRYVFNFRHMNKKIRLKIFRKIIIQSYLHQELIVVHDHEGEIRNNDLDE